MLDLIQQSLESFCATPGQVLTDDPPTALMPAIEDAADNALGISRRKPVSSFSVCMKSAAETCADQISEQISKQLSTLVLAKLDSVGHRIGMSEAIHRGVSAHVEQLLDQFSTHQRALREQLSLLTRRIEEPPARGGRRGQEDDRTDDISEVIRQYGTLRLEDFLTSYASRVAARVRSQLDQLILHLASIRQECAELADEFENPHFRDDGHRLPGMASPNAIVASLYFESTMDALDDLVAQLDQAVQHRYFKAKGGFCKAQDEGRDKWKLEFSQLLYRHARSLIAARIRVQGLDAILEQHQVPEERLDHWIEESIKLARPNLLSSCGGKSRLIAALPRGSDGKKLENALDSNDSQHTKLLPVTDGDIAFCYDVGGIPVHQIAAVLLQSCPRSADIIARVHTRSDVKWTPLIQLD